MIKTLVSKLTRRGCICEDGGRRRSASHVFIHEEPKLFFGSDSVETTMDYEYVTWCGRCGKGKRKIHKYSIVFSPDKIPQTYKFTDSKYGVGTTSYDPNFHQNIASLFVSGAVRNVTLENRTEKLKW